MKRYLIVLLILSASVTLFARSPLTFEERVKAQEAIERVYYNHRIWPKENPQPKPPFEKMVPKEVIETKVTDYLKKCSALDKFWQRPIEPKQLQAEMDRMAKGSKDPATLNELFAALNNDPYLIAECLAKPVLADRLIKNWYANDERFHKEAREQAEKALQHLTPENFCGYSEGQYSKMTYRLERENREEMNEPDPDDNSIKIDEKEFAGMLADIPKEGKLSGIIEKSDSFFLVHTLEKNESQIEIENIAFFKQGLNEWLKSGEIGIILVEPENSQENMFLPPTLESTCTEGWDNGILNNYPGPRFDHTAVWTGSEMIIWGGMYYHNGLYDLINTGGCYNPSTDSWVLTSIGVNCPSARDQHTAIWTGTEMIVWGGNSSGGLNTGGRYDPLSDSWTATSTTGDCPSARLYHTAVWTGTEMIIWGGGSTSVNTGGKYYPSTDTWVATSTGTNCPSARSIHTAVWTNSEMIIWGGSGVSGCNNDGGRYNPGTDIWTAISTSSGCPSAREQHTAVWTGTKMIIWGGYINVSPYRLNTGGQYDPSSDTWTATSTETNCPTGRDSHTAVWTNTEMIIWGGGATGYYNDGGRYNPSTDTWLTTSTVTNCPSARSDHTAVWSGSEMIIWGGGHYNSQNSGARYNPSNDSWVPTAMGCNTPSRRRNPASVWTGTEMIIWGGYDGVSNLNTGGRYRPSTDNWTITSTGANCPSARTSPAVWTGSEMIVWGGYNSGYLNSGGRYNPASDTWMATTTTGAPSGRGSNTAVWTGSEMIIWGGYSGSNLNTGGKYDPNFDNWTLTSTGTNCPSARSGHTAVWGGSEMIIWGGASQIITGARYNPSSDSWLATSTGTNCPSSRAEHSAIWGGSEMIIWGGYYDDGMMNRELNSGCRYNPSSDSWLQTSVGANVPEARHGQKSVWTGTEMIVWGGYTGDGPEAYLNSGGRYNPLTNSWLPTLTGDYVPLSRNSHIAVWTGTSMIVWGGYDGTNAIGYLQTGGRYYIPYSPSGLSNNLAGNSAGCSDSGVSIEWTAPSTWGDGGSGPRTYDVLRDSNPIATSLSESTLSYTDTTGDNDVSYLYQVRANNGCGLSTTTTGVSAADNIGTTPDEVLNFNDMYSWDAVSGADGYRLYRGTLTDLPDLMTLTTDGCLRYEGAATSYDLSGEDPSEATGGLYWYLVTAYTGVCEGSAGEGTGFTRVLSSSGSCP